MAYYFGCGSLLTYFLVFLKTHFGAQLLNNAASRLLLGIRQHDGVAPPGLQSLSSPLHMHLQHTRASFMLLA